mmetsp:Transcript_31216/g.67312  ORF Transcript_31216/g.67312 Transcript_31216/m.67312 type:complete len:228 (+) Transcript_31216:696-1379(+)
MRPLAELSGFLLSCCHVWSNSSCASLAALPEKRLMLAAASSARFILPFHTCSKVGNSFSTLAAFQGGGVGWISGCFGSFRSSKVFSSTPYATGCCSWLTLPCMNLSTHSGSACRSLLYAFMSSRSMPSISVPMLARPRASTFPSNDSIRASFIIASCCEAGYCRRSGKLAGRGKCGSSVAGSSSPNLSSKRGVAFSRPRGVNALGKPFWVERRKVCSANHFSWSQSA